MNTIKKFFLFTILGASILSLNSCKDDFEKINSDIKTIYDFEPERLLYNTQVFSGANGWEWYYDYYYAQQRWLQYGVRTVGNTNVAFTYFNPNVFKQRYDNSFMTTGSYMRHMEYLASQLADADRYKHAVEAARVTLIYQGIFTSDAHGSLAYTQGWSLRSGGDITEPEFETQETLYQIWDTELKNAINVFKTATNQVSIADYDMAYSGDISKWIKAANALRLRLALRYMKRDMNKAKAIATEVLASSEIPSSTDDGLIFWFSGVETNHGDFESIQDLIRASVTFMGYLKKYDDPRKRMFFRENNLTPENVAAWNAANPNDNLSEYERWEGGTANFDNLTDTKWTKIHMSRTLNGTTDMRPINIPQTRMFSGYYDGGSGGSWMPKLTHADFCFMAAEFALEGVASSKTAEQWYTEGVRSSLELWNKAGEFCKIHNYVPMTGEEITTFLNKEGIKWNAAIGKQQIYAQTYVEHFKNVGESHALYRRTGYPNPTSPIIANEACYVNGSLQQVPRRTRFSYPLEGTTNYENQVKRIDEMKKDPDFGDITNEFGRIWWDKK